MPTLVVHLPTLYFCLHVNFNLSVSSPGIETAAAEMLQDRLCCGMKTITSNVLLTVGGAPTPASFTSLASPVTDAAPPVETNKKTSKSPPDKSDVLREACQTIPLTSTLHQDQEQLICSDIGFGDAEQDASVVDDDDDMWRTLLDSTSQPGGDTMAAPDDESVVAMLTELETAEHDQPATESEQVPVECNICGNTYQLFSSLFKHVRDTHSADPRYRDALKHVQDIRFRRLKRKSALSLACWLCGEQCFGSQLYKHISVAHGDRSDLAELLKKAKTLYGREARSVYKRSTPADSQAQCTHCQRSFAKNYLKKHFAKCQRLGALSASATRMRCEICNKQFTSGRVRYEHRKTVHGLLAGDKKVQSFFCLVCNKEFRARARLRYHMLTHTGKFICCFGVLLY